MMSIYFIRRQYIPLSESIAVELEAERALNQEIITSLLCGLLVYNFASNRVIISNKIDELLLEALLSINQKGLAMFNHFHLDVDQRYIIDASALHKVISLLVNNAITTTAYGKVSLVIDHKTGHTDRLIFHINDTGSSISDEEISNLSYPFLS